jgi:hypothetical protein
MRFAPAPALAGAVAVAMFTTALALPAWAKLPPPSDEAKAKSAEAALKTAWGDKVSAFQLCKAMDRAAAAYQATAKRAGKEPAVPVETPPCADPGAFAPPAATQAAAADLKPAPKK